MNVHLFTKIEETTSALMVFHFFCNLGAANELCTVFGNKFFHYFISTFTIHGMSLVVVAVFPFS